MRCADCRKNEALDTWPQRLRYWFMFKLFSRDISDEKASSFTQGIADGYKLGREHERAAHEHLGEFL